MSLRSLRLLALASAAGAALTSCCPYWCKPCPAPAGACATFGPPPAAGTQYGSPAQTPGTKIFTAQGIGVSVQDFAFIGGGTTFNFARVEPATPTFGNGQIMHTNNITLEFDLGALHASSVTFAFLDLGGSEDLIVNGHPFAGDLTSAPPQLGGTSVSVTTTPVAGGKKGTVTLTGPVKTLRVGGQEFWLDDVCAR